MKNLETVQKILKCIEKIENYCANISFEEFSRNTLLSDACVFNLSQIGEFTTRLEPEFLQNHSNIPWHQIKGLRNRIVHDYNGVSTILVWEIISEDLPVLKNQIDSLLH